MKKKILMIGVVIGIVIAIIVTSNNKVEGGMNIGMISILSGEYSVVGENFTNGALLAVDIHNKNNPDNLIEFTLEDDGFETKKAISAYKKLTGINDIDALINMSTPSIGAIYDDLTAANIPTIQGGEQPIAPEKDNVFQIMPGNIPLEKELGEYLKAEGYSNPVVAYTQHDTMIRFKNSFIEGYGSDMKEFVMNPADTEFKTLVTKIAAEDPDILILLAFPQGGAQLLNEYLKQEGDLPQLAFDASAQSGFADYVRILGDASLLNGSIVATIQQEISDQFISDYKEKFGTEPGFFADLGYDAVNILVETRGMDNEEWVKNLEDVKFSGVTGKISFDNEGVRSPVVKIVEVVNGEIGK